MSIDKAYLMPHAPIFLKEIGSGKERQVQDTLDAMHEIGKEIQDYKPETVIVISPHGTVFSDGIAILYEEKLQGDFSDFGDPRVKMEFDNDTALIDELKTKLSFEHRISSALLDKELANYFQVSYRLDHGAMVPLYFVTKHISKFKVVSITYGLLSVKELYKVGMAIEDSVKAIGRKAILIASGDMSHALKNTGPYSHRVEGPIFDETIRKHIDESDLHSILTMDDKLCTKAQQCGKKSIEIMLGVFDGSEVKSSSLSYQGDFGVGYLTGRFERTSKKAASMLEILAREEKERSSRIRKAEDDYVALARKTIESYIKEGRKLEPSEMDLPKDLLSEKSGVFVSLKDSRGLRGCIGTFMPSEDCLADEIISNAISSATKDPRFEEVEEWELDHLEITVDVLSKPEKIDDIGMLDPKKYGVIVTSGYKRGLLLPDLEGVETVQRQLEIAKSKAGIGSDEQVSLERFEVIRHH